MSEIDREGADTRSVSTKPRQISWLWVLLAIAIFAILVEFRGKGVGESGTGHPAVGHTLPNLRLQALTGDSQDVTLADLAGDVAVVNFWGTWCPPCREEFPEIATLWAQLRSDEHFRLLAVSCSGDNVELAPLREATTEFLTAKQSQLPTYADRGGFSRRNVGMALDGGGFPGYPTTIVLDQTGVIRAVWIGYEPHIGDQIKKLVGKLLAAKN